eukprot:s2362_g1.t3
MVRCPRGRLLQVCLLWEGLQAPAGTSDEIVESQDRVIHPSEHFYALMDCTDDADADRRLMREVLRHTGLVASEYPEAEMRDLSRRIYQNWSGVAAEQLSLAEVHLLIYPRGFWHEEPVQMHLLQELWKQVGLDEAQQGVAMHVLQSEAAQKELHSRTRDFCVVPYLAAMVVLIHSDPENREEYLEHLCSLMGVPSRLHWGLMLILSSLHFADEVAEQLVSALEAHGVGSCAVGFHRHPELPRTSGAVLEASHAEHPQLRVVLWSGHIFAFDGLLASLEAAEKMGMASEALILSYAVAGRWGAARQQCEQLQESLGLGSSLCLGSAADVLMDWCTSMGIGTETGCSIHDVRQTLQKLRHEVPTLWTADLLICGYPYALCPILGTSGELRDVPMLVLVHGAGSLAEYADESITPWILGTFKRWIASDPAQPTKGTTAMASRKVVFNDRLDLVLARAAFGEASQPQLVEFGARYVLRLAGGIQCDRRLGDPRRLLLWRSQSTFPALVALGIERMFTQVVRSIDWSVEQMPVAEVREFHYPELQDFSAVLQIPWDFGLVSFQEVLALGLPVLMPSSQYMHALITTVFLARSNLTDWNEKWKRRFLQLVPDMWEGFVPPASNRILPMIRSEQSTRNTAPGKLCNQSLKSAPHRPELRLVEQVSSWWRYTEFETNRWVKRFLLPRLNPPSFVSPPCATSRETMATIGRAFIFLSVLLLADAMFKKGAKQLVTFQEPTRRPGVSLQSAGRNLLESGRDLRSFSRENGVRKAAGAPVTPALLAAQPLKWMHTPKCGTSFLNVLIHLPDVCPGVDDSFQVNREVMGDLFEVKFEDACPYVCDGTKFLCNAKPLGLFHTTHVGVGLQYEFLKGHLVTMMRDPMQRIFSAYSDQEWSHGSNNKDIVTYAHSEAHLVTCQIMRDGLMDPPPASCRDLNETDAEQAVTRIREGFAFVGLVEEWDLSICLLHRMFGGDCLASDFMDSRPTFSGDTTNHEYNTSVLEGYDDPVDRLLYNGAKELFAERLLEYNVSQESCQPCFAQAKLKSNLADLNTLLKVLDPGALCSRLRQETAYKLRQSLRFHQLLLADIWQAKWSAEDPS